jgi:RNA recognition motif-containing protein
VVPHNSLYLKNLDKKVERKDFVERIGQMFEDVDKEVEIVVMKKGRMRGQGFMNFQNPQKAKEVYEALQGIVIGQKAVQIEFSTKKIT